MRTSISGWRNSSERRVTNEEHFDNGLLFIRSFSDGWHLGVRVYDMKCFKYPDKRKVKTAYEVQELSDRKNRAGLGAVNQCEAHAKRHSVRAEKHLQDDYALAREWMTRKWTGD